MKTRVVLIAALVSSFASHPAAADWQAYRQGDGLGSDYVRQIVNDGAGNLWFGGLHDIVRFDGIRWTSWSTNEMFGSYSTYSFRIASGRKPGRIWVASGDGVARHDSSGWVRFPFPGKTTYQYDAPQIEEDDSGSVWVLYDNFGQPALSRLTDGAWSADVPGVFYRLFLDREGRVWATGPGAIVRLSGAKAETITPPTSGFPSATSFLEGRDHTFWLGTAKGAYHLDAGGWRFVEGLASEFVTAISEDSTGAVWFCHPDRVQGGGGGAGVSRVDGKSVSIFTVANGLTTNDVAGVIVDPQGHVWAWPPAAGGSIFDAGPGLSRFDGVGWRVFTAEDGLPRGYGTDPVIDDAGGLWFIVPGTGVARYDGSGWQRYSGANVTGTGYADFFFQSSKNDLWLASWDGGLARFDGKAWRHDLGSAGLDASLVFQMLEDRAGTLWCVGSPSEYDRAYSWNGTNWRKWTAADGLSGENVTEIHADRTGAMWFVCLDLIPNPGEVSTFVWRGLSRRDSSGWSRFTTADGLLTNEIHGILETRDGSLWFGSVPGLMRYQDGVWTRFDGPDDPKEARPLLEDPQGRVWCLAHRDSAGVVVARYDGIRWEFLPAPGVYDGYGLFEDSEGSVWLGTSSGVRRWDGNRWDSFLADPVFGTANFVSAILQDRTGALWFGTEGGATRYFRGEWGTLTSASGLLLDGVKGMLEDRSGTLWFATGGVTRYDPDRTAPRTVILTRPAGETSQATPAITFGAGFRETRGIAFSTSLDGEPWSSWSPVGAWGGTRLPDGDHEVRVRARDEVGNVAPPTLIHFTLDATPPAPRMTAPADGAVVQDSLVIVGTTTDERFRRFTVDLRPLGAGSWDTTKVSRGIPADSATTDQPLAGIQTRQLDDGQYELRLSVLDDLDLVGSTIIDVLVDNHPPYEAVTAPKRILPEGGDLYTRDGAAHLYFPPGFFPEGDDVDIRPLATGDSPDSLTSGIRAAGPEFDIVWKNTNASHESKKAILEIRTDRAVADSTSPVALYAQTSASPSSWQYLGGATSQPGLLSVPIDRPGRYLVASGTSTVGPTPGTITLTPRVFSPGGNRGRSTLSISFSFPTAERVTAAVFNRAGRLMRRIADDETMEPGFHVLQWDGTDGDGRLAQDGIYIVSVKTGGQQFSKTVAIVH